MDFTGNSKQPFVDWVKGRERQLELLTAIARTRIDRDRSFSGRITVDNWRNKYVPQLGADSSVAPFTSQFWRMNALSRRQQEQVQGNSRLERSQLPKLPLSKRELNQSSQEEGIGQLLPAVTGTFESALSEGSPKPPEGSRAEDGWVKAGQWSGRKDAATSPADSLSNCCSADSGICSTAAQRSPQAVLRREINDAHGTPHECFFESYDRNEDDESLDQRVFEMQRIQMTTKRQTVLRGSDDEVQASLQETGSDPQVA